MVKLGNSPQRWLELLGLFVIWIIGLVFRALTFEF
jgi:hypothetical protein